VGRPRDPGHEGEREQDAERETLIRPGDPVVSSTNHGSATTDMRLPSEEITSAAMSAMSERRSTAPVSRPAAPGMMARA